MYITESLLSEIKSPNVFGSCDDDACFAAITRAVSRGNNPALFDASIGNMALCVCSGYVTLPADVQTLLAVVQGRVPMVIRSEWFEYSLSGTGTQDCVPCGFTTVAGHFSTISDLVGPNQLIAEIESAADNQKELRVYGWDSEGKRIYTMGPNGVLEDGVLVPLVFGFSPPNSDAPNISRIDRVRKSETNGTVRLIAINADDPTKRTLLGHYLPWETAPIYQRLKVACKTYLRIKYKRNDIRVRGIGDWININNTEALFLLLKAVRYVAQDDYDRSHAAMAEAMRLLSEEQQSKMSPAELNQPTIIYHERPAGGSPSLFY